MHRRCCSLQCVKCLYTSLGHNQPCKRLGTFAVLPWESRLQMCEPQAARYLPVLLGQPVSFDFTNSQRHNDMGKRQLATSANLS